MSADELQHDGPVVAGVRCGRKPGEVGQARTVGADHHGRPPERVELLLEAHRAARRWVVPVEHHQLLGAFETPERTANYLRGMSAGEQRLRHAKNNNCRWSKEGTNKAITNAELHGRSEQGPGF